MTKTYHYEVRPFVYTSDRYMPKSDMTTDEIMEAPSSWDLDLKDIAAAIAEKVVLPPILQRYYSRREEDGEPRCEIGQLQEALERHVISREIGKLQDLADESVPGRIGLSPVSVMVAERDPTPNYWVGLYEQLGLSDHLDLQVVKVEVLQYHPYEGPAVDPETHELIEPPEDVYGEEVTIEHYNVDGLYSSVTISHPNHSHYPLYVADKLLLACAQLHDLSLNQLAA